MMSLRQWWRRAAAALKDRRSLLLARLRPRRAPRHHRELEAAVVRATSHEDRWVDYRSAVRVFAWARSSSLRPIIMRALARRARRTRCWAVALKALMVAHGLLTLRPRHAGGRVPFPQLAEFRDRSSSPAKSVAFSAFVRAYYRFLDCRSLFAAQDDIDIDSESADRSDYQMICLDRIKRLQVLLNLLLQIRPYADGMDVPLVLEAMDCAVIEIFQVHGEICTGLTRFLVSGVPDGSAKPRMVKAVASAGVEVLWRAAEQGAQLSSYFELCRGLGVVNARRLSAAAFDRLRHEDVRNLERIIMDDVQDDAATDEPEGEGSAPVDVKDDRVLAASTATVVVTTEWVAFDEEKPSSSDVSCAGQSEGRVVGGHWMSRNAGT